MSPTSVRHSSTTFLVEEVLSSLPTLTLVHSEREISSSTSSYSSQMKTSFVQGKAKDGFTMINVSPLNVKMGETLTCAHESSPSTLAGVPNSTTIWVSVFKVLVSAWEQVPNYLGLLIFFIFQRPTILLEIHYNAEYLSIKGNQLDKKKVASISLES